MLLTITIPTYNRSVFLINNLKSLARSIMLNSWEKDIDIFISDNCSTDNTEQEVKRFSEENEQIKITYHKQKKNHGVTNNQIFCMTNVESQYFMTLGDDDYIDDQYLKKAIKMIRSDPEVTCIIPSYKEVTAQGKIIENGGRDLNKESKLYPPSYKNCLEHSWRGHQLSGLIFKSENLVSELKNKKVFNMYPFIFCIAFSCLHGKAYHLTSHPVIVTNPGQENKNWSYQNDGLITEIFDNYRRIFPNNMLKRSLLEMKFLILQSWRLRINFKKNKKYLFLAIFNIIKSPNTSLLTSLILPFYMLYDLLQNAIKKVIELFKKKHPPKDPIRYISS